MIIDHTTYPQFKERELFYSPGTEIQGKGFLGIRTEVRAGMGHKTSSIGVLSNAFVGSYTCACDGFYQNCSLGNYGSFADGVKICGSHAYDRISTSVCTVSSDATSPLFSRFKGRSRYIFSYHTMIGHDVWLGSNVQIKNGLLIGHGAVVGAGAVVTKHVPPYAIVGGSPAKIIRMRFPEQDIERLLKCAWYLYDWQDIEIDWEDMHRSLEQMEEHIAAQDVPLLGDGFAYKSTDSQIQLTPANWTLERQFEVSYGKSDLLEVLQLPNVQKHTMQV